MLRSLYSGISGMKNFQTKLDVVANNISNINTAGYKKSRVTFKDIVSQQLSGASSSTANRGSVPMTMYVSWIGKEVTYEGEDSEEKTALVKSVKSSDGQYLLVLDDGTEVNPWNVTAVSHSDK
ncbi:hypothetical protein DT075_25310 [Bacillus licheniformis]|nr:hypothetical protein DT075_25310 [Bacillus licheniformis]